MLFLSALFACYFCYFCLSPFFSFLFFLFFLQRQRLGDRQIMSIICQYYLPVPYLPLPVPFSISNGTLEYLFICLSPFVSFVFCLSPYLSLSVHAGQARRVYLMSRHIRHPLPRNTWTTARGWSKILSRSCLKNSFGLKQLAPKKFRAAP